jgi:hypothetical protein
VISGEIVLECLDTVVDVVFIYKKTSFLKVLCHDSALEIELRHSRITPKKP